MEAASRGVGDPDDVNNGEVAEWSMAVVLKTTVPGRVPGVRIPPSPIRLRSQAAGPEFLTRAAVVADIGSLL